MFLLILCFLGFSLRWEIHAPRYFVQILVGQEYIPRRQKGKGHEALSLVFQRDGVPPRMVVDNPKEQLSKKFKGKCREADCYLVTAEPYSPWMQAAEGCVKQVKLGLPRKLMKCGSPKPLWDHCLELVASTRTKIENSPFNSCVVNCSSKF